MLTAKLFKNGRSQAVRRPKECRFKGKEVGVVNLGNAVLLFQKDKALELMEQSLGQFTPDFMASRDQPKTVDRRREL
jgi:antitoxin VapB